MELLLILFIVLAVGSGLGISLLYLLKNPKAKNALFYFLGVWSMLIAFLNATSLPSNYFLEQVIAWAIGFIAIIAILIKILKPSKVKIAYLLVSVSALAGLFDLFFF